MLWRGGGCGEAKGAGRAIARLRSKGISALDTLGTELRPVAGVDRQDVLAALQTMADSSR